MLNYMSMIATIVSLLLAALPVEAHAKTISIDVKDADIHNVLRLLADVGHINIVVADGVSGKVTMKLVNVRWSDALDALLDSKNLGREDRGNVVRVDSLEAMTKRASLIADRLAQEQRAGELVTIMIRLSYARATELKPIVESMLTPRGKVLVEPRTNTLIITDVAGRGERIRRDLGI